MYNTISNECIAAMVHTFYGKIRQDRLLGPIFDTAIGDGWTLHLQKMVAFWSSVLLASATYKGNPMLAHLQFPRVTEHHFDRWLELWRETAAQLCVPSAAAIFVVRAEMIGQRLLYAIDSYHSAANSREGTAQQAI